MDDDCYSVKHYMDYKSRDIFILPNFFAVVYSIHGDARVTVDLRRIEKIDSYVVEMKNQEKCDLVDVVDIPKGRVVRVMDLYFNGQAKRALGYLEGYFTSWIDISYLIDFMDKDRGDSWWLNGEEPWRG